MSCQGYADIAMSAIWAVWLARPSHLNAGSLAGTVMVAPGLLCWSPVLRVCPNLFMHVGSILWPRGGVGGPGAGGTGLRGHPGTSKRWGGGSAGSRGPTGVSR